MRIRVIANKPSVGQNTTHSSIEKLIGKTFEGKLDTEDGTVSIHSPAHGGKIVLNRGEFVKVRK